MNKFISIFTQTASILYFSIALCSCQNDDVIIRIDKITEEKTFDVPLKSQKGWITRSIEILENTANDSIRLGPMTLLAPKWTGLLYYNDEYNVEPTTYHYTPYKATKGIVVIRYRVSKY
jgi:hypothetical protein